MGGSSGRAEPLLPIGDPAGRQKHPVAGSRESADPSLPAALGRTAQSQSKIDPTSGPKEGSAASCLSVAGLGPTLCSQPLDHRAEGRSSPSRAFPRPRGGGKIVASRLQQLTSPNLSTAPPPLPTSFLRARIGPRLRVIYRAPYLESRTSPLPWPARSAIRRWRPLPGHQAGAPWGHSEEQGRGSGTRSPAERRNPRASHRGSPLPQIGVRALGLSWDIISLPGPDPGQRGPELSPRPGHPHAP